MSKKKKRPAEAIAEPPPESPAAPPAAAKHGTRKKTKQPADAQVAGQAKAKDGPLVAVDWTSPAGRLVGARIQHWWDGEESWFTGRVLKYNATTLKHLIRYDADDEEIWLDFHDEYMLYCERVRGSNIIM